MTAVFKLPVASQAMSSPLAVAEPASAFACATERQREQALAMLAVMRVIDARPLGLSASAFIATLAAQIAAGSVPASIKSAVNGIACSAAAMSRAYANWQCHGLDGLLPQHRGRTHRAEGWEAAFLQLWNRPQKPPIASVVHQLQPDFPMLTERKARTLVHGLPARLGPKGPGRMGRQFYQQSIGRYKPRDLSQIEVGEVWQGDGHRVDVYMAHPVTGKVYRPELTLWIDVRSRYVVGWYLSDNESSQTTLLALCDALRRTRHKPGWLHVDNGSGFCNRMLHADNVGFFSRLDVSIIHSIPGCPRGKGQVERMFRTIEDDYSVHFDSYCGYRMAPEINRRLSVEVANGKRKLPALAQWVEGFQRWLERYHQRLHRGLAEATPAQLWSQLQPNPVPDLETFDLREARVCNVRRCMITLDKRQYFAPALEDWNHRQVTVEYLLTDDASIRVLDASGRWLCDAQLVSKLPYLPASRLAERRIKNDQQKLVRLERHAEEARARARGVLGAQDELDALESFGPLAMPGGEKTEAEGLPPLDLLDTDYGDLP